MLISSFVAHPIRTAYEDDRRLAGLVIAWLSGSIHFEQVSGTGQGRVFDDGHPSFGRLVPQGRRDLSWKVLRMSSRCYLVSKA